MKTSQRITAALLAGFILLSTAACGGNTKWVLAQGEDQLPAGVYLNYMTAAYVEARSLAMEGQGASLTSKELLATQVENTPADQWIATKAMESSRQYFAVENKFAEMNLALNETETSGAQYLTENVWESIGSMYEQNGISKDSMNKYYLNETKKQAIFNALYSEGGERAVDTEQLKQSFQDDYIKVKTMFLYKNQGTEEETAKLKEIAEKYKGRVEAGENFEQLLFESNQELRGESAEGTVPEEGANDMIIRRADAVSGYGEAFAAGLETLEMGKTTMVEDENYFYVIKRVDQMEKPEDFENYRTQILAALKGDEFKADLAAWAAELSLTENAAAIKRYTPDKLKI